MRRLKFNIRWLLLVVAVIAVVLAFATGQRRIASELRGLDASLSYRYEFDHWDDVRRYTLKDDAELPPLLAFFGADVTSTIVGVWSVGATDPARVAELSSELPHLRILRIQGTCLRDKDLRRIANLDELLNLYIRDTEITDAAVEVLSGMTRLRVLDIQNTKITDAGIETLKKSLPNTRIRAYRPWGRMG